MQLISSVRRTRGESVSSSAAAIHDAIARFQAAPELAPGEWPAKIEAVNELERLLPAPEALSFLLAALRDPTEYDLARVEICKIIRATPMSEPGIAAACADALLAALSEGQDDLIRRWAAQAMAQVIHVAGVCEALARRVADSSEDVDVRFNALASLRLATLKDPDRRVLATAADDLVIGPGVRAVLLQSRG